MNIEEIKHSLESLEIEKQERETRLKRALLKKQELDSERSHNISSLSSIESKV